MVALRPSPVQPPSASAASPTSLALSSSLEAGLRTAAGSARGLKQATAVATHELVAEVSGVLEKGSREAAHIVQALRRRSAHQGVLAEAVPEVAVLCAGDAGGARGLDLPESVQVTVDVEVVLYGDVQHLLVLRPSCNQAADFRAPAKVIVDLLAVVQRCKALAGARAWPLHDPKVSEAIMAMEAEELAYGMHGMPWWKKPVLKLLRALRITAPSIERVSAFELQFGPGVEFMFAWSAFFIQQSWLLVLYSIVWLLMDCRSFRTERGMRWLYELMKAIVVLWCAWVAFRTTRLHRAPSHSFRSKIRRGDLRLSSFVRDEPPQERAKRWLTLLLVALPVLLALLMVVTLAFAGVTLLVLQIVYIWGDCLKLHSEARPCRDASYKYSLLGWAAEVSVDILLAILFEIFFSLGTAFSGWIARLLNYQYESDMLLFKEMLELGLAAIERLGFVGSLAFFFVPQWEPSSCGVKDVPVACDCSDLMMGENDYVCFQRRLPLEMRRWLFESLMKGPFIVAPFVNILVKVIVPKLVQHITRTCSWSSKWRCLFWLAPLRAIVRFCTLIFTYDGESVRCFTYVFRGTPFADLPEDLPEREKVSAALEQYKVKPFEVEDELMELEMSLLWLTFFMPILPQGVIVTIVAKLLEINTDVTKMLYVRRRPVPTDDRTMRREIIAYSWCVTVAGAGWTAGLSLITYNDTLYEWKRGGRLILLGMFATMVIGPAVTLWVMNRCTVSRRIVPGSWAEPTWQAGHRMTGTTDGLSTDGQCTREEPTPACSAGRPHGRRPEESGCDSDATTPET